MSLIKICPTLLPLAGWRHQPSPAAVHRVISKFANYQVCTPPLRTVTCRFVWSGLCHYQQQQQPRGQQTLAVTQYLILHLPPGSQFQTQLRAAINRPHVLIRSQPATCTTLPPSAHWRSVLSTRRGFYFCHLTLHFWEKNWHGKNWRATKNAYCWPRLPALSLGT